MNDRWVNFAVAISIMSIMVNGFILMAANQPDANNQYSYLFVDSVNNELNYDMIKISSNINLTSNANAFSDSSNSPSSEQGFTPAINDNGQPVGIQFWDYVQLGAVGFEKIMLKLGDVFSFASPIFYALAGVALFCKAIVGFWIFTIILRPIFGRVW